MHTLTMSIIELVIGILLNIFIGKLAVLFFRKDNTASRFPIRFLGIFFVIDSILGIIHRL